jgi:hypothetical protein
MHIFNRLISRASSVKYLFYLFPSSHAILLVMMTYTLPKINTHIDTYAFELQTFGYSVSEARSIANNMNDQITNLYLFPQLSLLDLLYPFLLALFLSSFLFRLISITRTKNKVNSILLIVPFLAMIFDYLENICIILMITKSVETSENFVLLSIIFTFLKGVSTSFAWISILFYSIKWFRMKKWKEMKNNYNTP